MGARIASAGGRRAAASAVAAAALASVVLASCAGTAPSGNGTTTSTTQPAPPTTQPAPPTTQPAPPTTQPAPPTTQPAPPTTQPAPALSLGSSGAAVLTLQRRLEALHYWLGTPDGQFGDSTQQAVYALQKAAGIARDGVVGPQTEQALAAAVEPTPRPTSGYAIEVDLRDDLLMLVTHGTLLWALNTSTGGGYVYTGTAVADTPVGTFTIYREVDGLVTAPLGELWRPKYFYAGYAIHGYPSVPPYPVSHGCVRLSNEAINWLWSSDKAPIGTVVWVFA